MKKIITIFCILASLLIILDSINFGYSLMTFLFVGIIPGTNIQLTPEQAFGLFAITISLIVVYFKSPTAYKHHSTTIKQIRPKIRRLKNT